MKKCSRKIAMEYGNAYSNTKFICWRKIMSITLTAANSGIGQKGGLPRRASEAPFLSAKLKLTRA